MQEEEERKRETVVLSVPLWAKWLSDEDSRSAREERKNVNLRPKTQQNHKMGEQTLARERATPLPGKGGRIQLHRAQAEGSKVQGGLRITRGGDPH